MTHLPGDRGPFVAGGGVSVPGPGSRSPIVLFAKPFHQRLGLVGRIEEKRVSLL